MISKVRKRDGRLEEFISQKITNAVLKALKATKKGSKKLAENLSRQVINELEKLYSGKIPSVESIQDIVEDVLIKNKLTRTAKAYILYRQRHKELREFKEFFGVKDDLKLGINAIKVLQRRYLARDEKGNVIETPSQLFRRVAKTIASVDKNYGKKETTRAEEQFYNIMTNQEFMPNTPCLVNAGKELGQLAACFVLPVEDSIESIFDTLKLAALIHKSGGGTGFNFSHLRPHGDIVKSTGQIASGPISFMKIYDNMTEQIKQGGVRRGANMGILNVNHPDILEFITAKSDGKTLSNFNISVGVTDDFMQRAENGKDYELINPRTNKVVGKLNASQVLDMIIYNAWKTGDPGLVFLDEINRRNPTKHIGEIESTNPCVTSDTWIMTSEGSKQVKELINKEFRAIINGREFVSKEGFFSTGKKDVYKLKTKEGFEVRLTSEHPILIVKKITRQKIETEWKKISELNTGDKIVLNNHRGFDGWSGNYTEKEGYLIGLLVGDGWISKDKTYLATWGDDEGSVSVRNLAFQFANTFPHRADFRGWLRIKNTNSCRMALTSLQKISSSLGMKHNFKTITEELEKTSVNFYRGFLKGFSDCDGSVQGFHEKGISIRLAQSNLEVLKAVQRMLLRIGIFSVIYENRRLAGKRMMPDGNGSYKEYNIKSQHELVIANDNILQFHKKIGFTDSIKMEKLERLIKKYKRTQNRERFIAVVKEIVNDEVEDVYDVRIDQIHSFDGNGFILHNCGEQPLHPYESCNLGSINLSKLVKNKKINWKKLKELIWLGIRFLDNVIDANRYPAKEIEYMTKTNRRIGLGIMGFAEMLIKLGISYNSDKALKVAEQLMKFIEKEGHKSSQQLGKEKGNFPNFKLSSWRKKGYKFMRNATVLTIAPTGSISIIAGCSSGIEPLFAVAFVRNVMEGTRLLEVTPTFEEIAKKGKHFSPELFAKIAKTGSIQNIPEIPGDVKKLFVTALEISPEWHVKMQAVFQKHTDNAVSKTINLRQDATPDDVRKAYILAWKLKCKGITIYRYGSKENQVLTIGSLEKELGDKHVIAESEFAGGCAGGICPH